MCLLVQIENLEGLANLEAIAQVEGVDGVFIGPADLSASMGYRGNPGHPAVQAAIEDAIARVRQAGKAAGSSAQTRPWPGAISNWAPRSSPSGSIRPC